ncbi:PilN domain-containing protein [Candidatus Woesebacteria bacterium]|nr:PilN domain-containing protein [Candidatus Woesebacteria bacterium]
MAAQKKRSLINLLPSDDYPDTLGGRIIAWLLTTFRFMVIAVELVVISGFLFRFFLDTQNADLTDEINQKKALISSYLPFENEFKKTQKQLTTFVTFANEANTSEPIFAAIAAKIPENIKISAFSQTGPLVNLRVTSNSEPSVAGFVADLQKDERFANTLISQIENRGATAAVTTYTIEINVKEKGAQNGS